MNSRLAALNSWLAARSFTEGAVVVAFIAALFCFNVLTVTLYSITTDDEVLFSDPGVNLYLGHGFTSSAHAGQLKNETWSGNLPLYSLALSRWLKITGFGLSQVRFFSYFLAAFAEFFFWLALKRLQWLKAPLTRLMFLGIAFLSYPLFNAYRVARYDSLQILLTALILLSWSLRAGALRQFLLFLFGFLIAASGFNAVAYIGLVSLILLAWQRKNALWPALAVNFGLLAGVVSVLAFYYFDGIMGGFVTSILICRSNLSDKFQRAFWGPLGDPGVLSMMLILLLVLSQRALCVWDRTVQKLAIAGLVCSYVIVAGLEVAVHYTTYYHWMNQIILVGFVCAVLERAHASISGARKLVIVLLFGVTLLVAIPKNLFISCAFGEEEQYRTLKKFVNGQIRPDDVVFVDYLGYFPVKAKDIQVYMPAYLNVMTGAEEQSVTALLIKNLDNGGDYAKFGKTYADWFSRNGQKWKLVATIGPQHNKMRDWLEHLMPGYAHHHEAKTCGYQMSLYRRSDTPGL